MAEQVLIRSLPDGSKARLAALARRHNANSMEAQARAILLDALAREPLTLVDLISADDDIDFEPVPLGWRPREMDW